MSCSPSDHHGLIAPPAVVCHRRHVLVSLQDHRVPPSNGADSTGMVAFSPARDNEEILRMKHFQEIPRHGWTQAAHNPIKVVSAALVCSGSRW